MDAARHAGQSDLVMQLGRRSNSDRIYFEIEQRVDAGDSGAAQRARDEFGLLDIRIRHANEFGARQAGQHARMIAAHDADADHADTQRTIPLLTLATCSNEFPQAARLSQALT